MNDLKQTISANVEAVQQRISEAALRSGRTANDVKLVAVTKYAQDDWVQCLSEIHPVFGENRPQQLATRVPQFDPSIEWHLIGQLQRNKVRLALPLCHTIHSVDSWKLLDRIELLAGEMEVKPRILLEVNVSGEESKAGFQPDSIRQDFKKLTLLQHTQIDGLMTMAPAGDAESTRKFFSQLRQLADDLRDLTGLTLPELSMGMSGDFEVAIEEGATIVRVGSRLFDGLGYRG
ncbi:MAG: YggS family pyridoxal phosphate-dependent enzyme [Planctomycetaceae bacterium]